MNRIKFDRYCYSLKIEFSCTNGANLRKSNITKLRYYKELKTQLKEKIMFRLKHKWINKIPFITPLSYLLTAKQLLGEHFEAQPKWIKKELNI